MEKTLLKKVETANNLTQNEDRDYLNEYLSWYIDSTAKTRKRGLDNRWHFQPDEQASIKRLLLDYILEKFTLKELFLIFFYQQFLYGLSKCIIMEARRVAIENINDDDSITVEEAKILKRKVWDMHIILFGLIHNFIQQSDLFFDEETMERLDPR